MSLPPPEPGLVIHMGYLWAYEHQAGIESGRYPRPVMIVVCSGSPDPTVLVAPITHSEPDANTCAVEMPQVVKNQLGLDSKKSWVILDEVNIFEWPGCDLTHNANGSFAWGLVPPWFFDQIRAAMLANIAQKSLVQIAR